MANNTIVTKDYNDDDDEFGGYVLDINQVRAKCMAVNRTDNKPGNKSTNINLDEDDEFDGRTIDINEIKNRCLKHIASDTKVSEDITYKNHHNNSVFNKEKSDLISLPSNWDHIGCDAEFYARTDLKTVPFCITLNSESNVQSYLHPESLPAKNPAVMVDIRRKLKIIGELNSLRFYKTPFVILDFIKDTYNIEWRPIKDLSRRRTKTLKIYFFFSFKDLQYLWAKDADFLYYCLQYLERIRRITTKFNKPITLPYEIYLPTKKGMKWHSLSIELLDVSAMQGSKGLKIYHQNVGLPVDDKDGVWDWNKDNNPLNFFITKTKEFMNYIRWDVNLKELHDKTVDFYNDIAINTLKIKSRPSWGLSTGKIVASMVSQWLADRIKVPVSEKDCKDKEKPLYWYNRLSSPEAMKQLSHLTGNKGLLYLGMTDGGRCVKERSRVDVLDGVLVDIDINGCYGNGLLNQIFPIGNPSVIQNQMTFGDWEKEYLSHTIPGLWVARISWNNAPFKCDFLLSKEEKTFTAWEWYQSHFAENNSDADKQYDASMYLATNQVHMAALNHDIYQVIQNYASNEEKAWIRKNAIIECFAYYDKRDEVDEITQEMCELRSIKEINNCGLRWSTKWKRIDFVELIEPLLSRRKQHKEKLKLYTKYFGKNNKDAVIADVENKTIDGIEFSKEDFLYSSSIQEFIKLIVNTIYGCIASSFFAGDGTGISNFIVGNNITARARTLAWCMAKGLYSLMSITDGGVFNLNQVAYYSRKSLNIFAELGFDNYKGSNGQSVVEIKPLFGYEIPIDKNMFDILNKDKHVQNIAWKHLESIFYELDIFKYQQFSFEVKKLYTDCVIRNKSDYSLTNSLTGEQTIKIRGLAKKNGKDGDDVASSIFEDIVSGNNSIYELETTRLLGLNEWREYDSEKRKTLLPHDEISDKKKFFPITPLGCKFINSAHKKDVMRLYEKIKINQKPELMELLRMLESVESEAEYKSIKSSIKANLN